MRLPNTNPVICLALGFPAPSGKSVFRPATSSLPCSGYGFSSHLSKPDGKPSCPDCCYEQDSSRDREAKRVLEVESSRILSR